MMGRRWDRVRQATTFSMRVTTYRNGPSRILLHAIITLLHRVTEVMMACDKILLGPFLFVVTHIRYV